MHLLVHWAPRFLDTADIIEAVHDQQHQKLDGGRGGMGEGMMQKWNYFGELGRGAQWASSIT